MKQWNEGIPSLMSAVRESLGFNPFELVFGYSVRSSLKLIKERLLKDDPTREHQFDYVE